MQLLVELNIIEMYGTGVKKLETCLFYTENLPKRIQFNLSPLFLFIIVYMIQTYEHILGRCMQVTVKLE